MTSRSRVFKHDGDGRRLFALGGEETHGDAAERRNRNADIHANAAHGTLQRDAVAIELDLTNLPIRPPAVARRVAHRESERVEPQQAARPGGPVGTHD